MVFNRNYNRLYNQMAKNIKNKESKIGKSDAMPDFLKQYRACYPDTKQFFVTGDNLVFPDNPQAAEAHQNSIGKGELKTY